MQWIVENFVKESSYTELCEEILKQGFGLTQIIDGYKHSDLEKFDNLENCRLELNFADALFKSKRKHDSL